MRNSWAQPSLSRDFALLSFAILFLLFLVSAWITFFTYQRHSARIESELEKEAVRIERTLVGEMENAHYLLSALGKHIVLSPRNDMVPLAHLLRSFDSKESIYSLLSWVDENQRIAVSSNRGVLDQSVDVSDRDYVKKSLAEPWKMHVGRPVEGRVSERWIIPVSIGLTDYTGRYIGAIMASLDINALTEHISALVKREGISFAIMSRTLMPLTQVSDDPNFATSSFPMQKMINLDFSKSPSGMVSQGSLFGGASSYAYYRVCENYPYVVLLGYDSRVSDDAMLGLLKPRLAQIILVGMFLVVFLWIVRARIIKPVEEMTGIAAAVSRGEPHAPLPRGGPGEIENLSLQIRRISDYITEIKRIEEELRNKTFLLKKAKERAEISDRAKSEFLAYICHELYTPLNGIVGYAQVMKDQLYGSIENRKYRQYATDIHRIGNGLLANVQDLITYAKAQADYLELTEKPVDIGAVINKAIRFTADRMQAEKLNIKVKLPDPVPRLVADEFRLHQIVANLLLYATRYVLPDGGLLLEARLLTENRDKSIFVFIISSDVKAEFEAADIWRAAEQSLAANASGGKSDSGGYPDPGQTDISLETARTLIAMHDGLLNLTQVADGVMHIMAFFGGSRVRFETAY